MEIILGMILAYWIYLGLVYWGYVPVSGYYIEQTQKSFEVKSRYFFVPLGIKQHEGYFKTFEDAMRYINGL